MPVPRLERVVVAPGESMALHAICSAAVSVPLLSLCRDIPGCQVG
jgi:hypothetical protein